MAGVNVLFGLERTFNWPGMGVILFPIFVRFIRFTKRNNRRRVPFIKQAIGRTQLFVSLKCLKRFKRRQVASVGGGVSTSPPLAKTKIFLTFLLLLFFSFLNFLWKR